MKNKIKKSISAVLAGVLMISVMSGCKKAKNTNVELDANGNFIPTQELALTIWNAQGTDFVRQPTSDEDIPGDWLAEKTKVKIDNIYGNDGGQWDTKLSKLIAGNNLPDVLYIAGGQGASHFAKLKEAGKLFELTPEMLQKYAPNVWNRVPENCWKALTTQDGKIMGIPFGINQYDEKSEPNMTDDEREFAKEKYQTIVTDNNDLYIRDDIAKKLYPDCMNWEEMCKLADEKKDKIGEALYDIPVNSTEDFIQMFKDIKNLNLSENGKSIYAFGYNGGDLWLPFALLGAQMYGYSTNNYITAWDAEKKEIVAPLRGDMMKQVALTQNRFIRDEIFDPESLVQTSAAFKENLYNGIYAVTCISSVGDVVTLNKQLEKLGKTYRYRPLYTKVPQRTDLPLQAHEAPWTASMCILNTLSEAEAIQVLNWVNVQFSDEFEEILWWGTPEDGLYTEENGVRTYVDDKFNKAYIDGESDALSVKECKGIGSKIIVPEAEYYVLKGFSIAANRWNPANMRKIKTYSSNNAETFKCKNTMPHSNCPQFNVFDGIYANIPEVVTFWAQRENWEGMFKVALTADSDESFNKQWEDAIANFNSVTDIDNMLKEMTEIAKSDDIEE